jgi:hypothetical protein
MSEIFEQMQKLPNSDITILCGRYYSQYCRLKITKDKTNILHDEYVQESFEQIHMLIPQVCKSKNIVIPQAGIDLIKYINMQKPYSINVYSFIDDNNNNINVYSFINWNKYIVVTINGEIAITCEHTFEDHPDDSQTYTRINELYYDTLSKYNINLTTIQKKIEDDIIQIKIEKKKKHYITKKTILQPKEMLVKHFDISNINDFPPLH